MMQRKRAASRGGTPAGGRGRGVFPLLPARRLLERRQIVVAVACLAYAGVFALRRISADPADSLNLLYVAPVALFALELGLIVGLGAALGAIGLTVMWWLETHSGFDPVAILTWTAAFLVVGGISGWFSDRMRDAQLRQRLLLQSGLTLTRLDKEEGLAAALAQQASVLLDADDVRVELTGTHPSAATAAAPAATAARDEHRVPLRVGGVRYGTLVFRRSKALTVDDQTAVSILALQASVAAENARLLVSERERAFVRAELSDARVRLDDRAKQLRELIDRVEAERTHVAYELHEQAAQMLAAVLMQLATLDRRLDAESLGGSLGQLRNDVGSTLQSVRSLAVQLKPSALELGLPSALQELIDARTDDGARTVAVADADGLDPETSLLVYRVVEEALQAVPVADSLSLSTRTEGRELALRLDGPRDAIESDRLAILRARVDLLGGELDVSETHLGIMLPLRPAQAPAPADAGADPSSTRIAPAHEPVSPSTSAAIPTPAPKPA